ncbi:MAG: M48 family metallopeptidase [Synergistaceae bacterium]|nr:M48 family metallopeptidase [Synergistaceae bacterium]
MKKIKKQNVLIEDISVELSFKAIKNMYLRVVPPLGEIRISAPHGTSMETVQQFTLARRQWILLKRVNLAEDIPTASFRCVEGDCCSLWGKEYLLHIEQRTGEGGVELDGSNLTLFAPPGARETQKKHILESWRIEQLSQAIKLLLPRWEPRMGLKVASVSLRRMKTRWGSCTPLRRTIRLTPALASTPGELLEYVLVHEMAHIQQPNHSPLFWSIVGKYLPDWKTSRKRLKEYSPEKI